MPLLAILLAWPRPKAPEQRSPADVAEIARLNETTALQASVIAKMQGETCEPPDLDLARWEALMLITEVDDYIHALAVSTYADDSLHCAGEPVNPVLVSRNLQVCALAAHKAGLEEERDYCLREARSRSPHVPLDDRVLAGLSDQWAAAAPVGEPAPVVTQTIAWLDGRVVLPDYPVLAYPGRHLVQEYDGNVLQGRWLTVEGAALHEVGPALPPLEDEARGIRGRGPRSVLVQVP